jgi:hypothetical protein
MTRFDIIGLAVLGILVAVASGAFAQTTCQTVGGFRYCNSNDGNFNSTGQRIGTFDYYNGTIRDPNTGQTRNWTQTCQQVGTFRYCN